MKMEKISTDDLARRLASAENQIRALVRMLIRERDAAEVDLTEDDERFTDEELEAARQEWEEMVEHCDGIPLDGLEHGDNLLTFAGWLDIKHDMKGA
jgi:hypothetical protein